MDRPPPPDTEILEYFLHPGEFLFLEGPARARTILGSCVAVTFWHPPTKAGAMCHYLMPARKGLPGPLDGRFGAEVLAHIIATLRRRGLDPRALEVKLFGGSNMMPELARGAAGAIGAENVETARKVLADEGFRIRKEDVGLCRHRNILFDLENGAVWLRQRTGKCEQKCLAPAGACPYAQAAGS